MAQILLWSCAAMTMGLHRYAFQTAIVVACVLALGADASAQTEADAPRTMSLEDALAHAKASHLQSLAARHRLRAAEREAEVPGAQWLPRVSGMAQIVGSTVNNSTTTLLGTSAVDVPRIGATPLRTDPDLQPYPSTAAGIGVRQQLFDFGRIAAERGAAASLAIVERHRATSAALDVELSVASAYYAVLAAHAIDDASRAANERATAHRDLAQANVRTGLRPPIELTRAEADVARYEAGMMRARAALHVARTTFAAAVGVEDVELDATPRWSEAEQLPPLERVLVRAALTPSVLERRALAEAQRAETHRLETQTRPDLFLTASITGRAGGGPALNGPSAVGAGWIPTVPNYGAGVVLTRPIIEPT
jgi:outer membrane protein